MAVSAESKKNDIPVNDNNDILFTEHLSIDNLSSEEYDKIILQFQQQLQQHEWYKLEEKPLNILTIGDPHFKVNNTIHVYLMCQRIVKAVNIIKPDMIVILGDTLDKHDRINVHPLCLANAFLHQLRLIAPLYLLIGNHDRPNNSDFCSPYHPFTANKYWENTYVIDKPQFFSIANYRIFMAPYVYPGRLMEALDQYIPRDLWSTADVGFTHQEYRNAKFGAIHSKIGDEWPLSYPMTFAGHIHEHQNVQANIRYIGAPMQHGYGDLLHKTISFILLRKTRDQSTLQLNDKITVQGEIAWQELRFDLHIPLRRTIRMKCTELTNDWLPPEGQIRLCLYGTVLEWSLVKKGEKYKELLALGVKIVHREIKNSEIPDVQVNMQNSSKGFKQMVLEKVANKPAVSEIFLSFCDNGNEDNELISNAAAVKNNIVQKPM